jgi:MinD superfamily P-loop ATPase
MKQVAVISGKGGTGKTSVAASLVHLCGRAIAVDCDVDAANLALLVHGEDVLSEPFVAGRRARIDADTCAACYACAASCRSRAIVLDNETDPPRIDPLLCDGCGVCSLTCPTDAISYADNVAGSWMIRRTSSGLLVHAALGIAQDNSGKLVSRVREEARRLARIEDHDLILIDGPPGIGCPVHASITGVDLVLAVTEPTASAEHDLARVLDLADHFKLEAAVLVNKHDLDPDRTQRITTMCADRGVEVAGHMPFDEEVPRALSRGELPLKVASIDEGLREAWKRLKTILEQGSR